MNGVERRRIEELRDDGYGDGDDGGDVGDVGGGGDDVEREWSSVTRRQYRSAIFWVLHARTECV